MQTCLSNKTVLDPFTYESMKTMSKRKGINDKS